MIKKIWVVTYKYGSEKAGPVIRFMRYAPHFEENNVDVTFVTKKREDDSHNIDVTSSNKVIYIECGNMVQLTKETLKRLFREKTKPDSLVFFSLEYRAFLYLLLVKLIGVKLIYVSTMRFKLENKEFGQTRNYFAQIFLRIIFNRLYSLPDVIVCSTKLLRNDFKKIGISEKKLKIIYNGVNTQKFRPLNDIERHKLREELNLPLNKIIYIFVGLFVERKGVDYLIKLWNEFINDSKADLVKLVMIGNEMLEINENSSQFKEEWPKIKNEAINHGVIDFRPFSNDIDKYYQASDVFIFTSKLEGMPNVILEAMASGNVILTSKFDGFSDDYGREGEQYYFLRGEIGYDLQTLRSIRDSLELRKKLSMNANAYALKNFALENSIKSYIDIFA